MVRRPRQSFSYAQVEGALAKVLEIAPDQFGAFAARLRHLRALDVPRSSKPGSGRRISYEWTHAAQMLVALLFQSLGCAPRISAEAAWAAEKSFEVAVTGPELMFAILPANDFDVFRVDQFPAIVGRQLTCAVVNLSRALGKLDAYLVADK